MCNTLAATLSGGDAHAQLFKHTFLDLYEKKLKKLPVLKIPDTVVNNCAGSFRKSKEEKQVTVYTQTPLPGL